MWQFILGVAVGSLIAFVTFAILSINKTDNKKSIPTPKSKRLGENSEPHE